MREDLAWLNTDVSRNARESCKTSHSMKFPKKELYWCSFRKCLCHSNLRNVLRISFSQFWTRKKETNLSWLSWDKMVNRISFAVRKCVEWETCQEVLTGFLVTTRTCWDVSQVLLNGLQNNLNFQAFARSLLDLKVLH